MILLHDTEVTSGCLKRSKMEFPLVSVIIPAFNSAGLLAETLDSVLGQTYRDLEILVVDDGSTDDTAKVVEAYGDQVRYFKQDNWGGPSRPRNVGVQNAGGSLIAIFDSDDLMMPDKIETAVDVFRRHPEVSFTFSNFQGIDQQGDVHKDDFLARYRTWIPACWAPGGATPVPTSWFWRCF